MRSLLTRYGLAVLLVAVAAGVRYSLTPIVGSITPLLFFTLAQVAVALLAGRGPGLLAVVLGTVVGYYLFLQPGRRLSGEAEVYYLLLNVCVGIALIWMADGMHRSRNEARLSETALRASHQRMSDLLARIGDAFFSFDLDWKCLYANQRAAALTGSEPTEMVGKTFGALLPGIFTGSHAALLQRALEDQAFLALDGVAEPMGIAFELSAYPAADSVSVFIRDVTDRKRAETAIARSEEQFRRIFDESPVGMTIVGMDGKFHRVNNAMCRMMEYTEGELMGMPTTQVTPVEDLETSGFYSQKQQLLVTGKIDHLQMEKRYVTKSGKIVWTNLNASVLREREDQRYFLGIIENITERRQVEEQLRESQKLESLGVLAGGIAHDFNNLLTGILGNASLGLDLAPANSPLRPLLQRLVKASERAADLTRQLLAYAGKGRFVISAISLSSMVQEISSLVRASFPGHVRLDLELASGLPAIEADPAQIQQVIMNLLLNAAESIPADRVGVVTVTTRELLATEEDLRGTLSSTRAQPGRYAALEVSDNGSGMEASTQARIFEPFFTTKFTGRGLGLSAVLGIVGSHKGALSVESQVGTGTRFRVLLPMTTKALDVAMPRTAPDPRGSGTILVVDDEPLVLSLARTALERVGYRVLVAASGTEAEEIMKGNPSDVAVVILDVTMPGMNGEEAFRRLKLIRPDVPVILSTGHSETETASRFAGLGLAGFLQKPYTASQLAEKIRSAFQPL
jgi:two-component system, cell cycle sensor histidine kinase and response regulator CckA